MASKAQILSVEKGHYLGVRASRPSGIPPPMVAWGYFIRRNRWSALATRVLATGWLLSFLPGLTVDNSTDSFLLAGDPAVIDDSEFRDPFGRDDHHDYAQHLHEPG
jgi:hypothetical protein